MARAPVLAAGLIDERAWMNAVHLDPRQHPWRDDLAAAYLRPLFEDGTLGEVAAPLRFASPYRAHARQAAIMTASPAGDAATSELLEGEAFDVFEDDGLYAWGQSCADGYVGYVASQALTTDAPATTHWVGLRASHVYPAPDLKRTPLRPLDMLAQVAVTGYQDNWAQLASGGWVPSGHLLPLGQARPNILATAVQFLGAPYRWGGRSGRGLDCSALIQLALCAAGIPAPRDSDQQQRSLGIKADYRRRGDLLFFQEKDTTDHVAFVIDEDTVLHATAFSMSVCYEPLRSVCARARMCDHRRLLLAPRCDFIENNSIENIPPIARDSS
ncbi:MAG: C40 family peptidase [Pseudomonadota bacterium]